MTFKMSVSVEGAERQFHKINDFWVKDRKVLLAAVGLEGVDIIKEVMRNRRAVSPAKKEHMIDTVKYETREPGNVDFEIGATYASMVDQGLGPSEGRYVPYLGTVTLQTGGVVKRKKGTGGFEAIREKETKGKLAFEEATYRARAQRLAPPVRKRKATIYGVTIRGTGQYLRVGKEGVEAWEKPRGEPRRPLKAISIVERKVHKKLGYPIKKVHMVSKASFEQFKKGALSTVYYGVGKRLVDVSRKDFGVHPGFKGKGFVAASLRKMERFLTRRVNQRLEEFVRGVSA